MSVIVRGNEITLTGAVGMYLFEDYFSHADVVAALATMDDKADVTIRLNSGGGDAADGIAIHNALRSRAGKTHVVIDGLAASAATAIAVAGDTVSMSLGSLFMVHEAAVTIFEARSQDLEEARRGQAAFTTAYVKIYQRKTGKSEDAIRAYLTPETWFTAEEAKAAGFVDQVERGSMGIAAAAPPFAYQAYAKAPERLVALARDNNWSMPSASPANPVPRKETKVSDKTISADAHAAATTRIKAIMQADEAAGRRDLAEHLAFNTTMDVDQALAVMSAAPEAGAEVQEYQPRRMNAQGLNRTAANGKPERTGAGRSTMLADAMKRKYGIS